MSVPDRVLRRVGMNGQLDYAKPASMSNAGGPTEFDLDYTRR